MQPKKMEKSQLEKVAKKRKLTKADLQAVEDHIYAHKVEDFNRAIMLYEHNNKVSQTRGLRKDAYDNAFVHNRALLTRYPWLKSPAYHNMPIDVTEREIEAFMEALRG